MPCKISHTFYKLVYSKLIIKCDYRINIVEVVMQVLLKSKMKHVSY